MKKLVFVVCYLMYALSLNAQSLEWGNDYLIYDVSTKQVVPTDSILARIQPGNVVFFGEQHDDSIAHVLQFELFKLLQQKYNNEIALSMEMFQKDVQYILDEYLSGLISEKNFIKEARAWNNYEAYKPLIEFAKEQNVDVIAANAPSRYTNSVTKNGLASLDKFPKYVKENFFPPLPVDTLTGDYYVRFLEVMGGHQMPGFHMYQSQSFWDATMSHTIAQYKRKHKRKVVLHLNGRFHSDYFDGTAGRIQRDYKQPVVVISSFYQDDIQIVDWEKVKGIADYLIVTKSNGK